MDRLGFLSTLVSAACGTLIGISAVAAVELFPGHAWIAGSFAGACAGAVTMVIQLRFNRFERPAFASKDLPSRGKQSAAAKSFRGSSVPLS